METAKTKQTKKPTTVILVRIIHPYVKTNFSNKLIQFELSNTRNYISMLQLNKYLI